LRAAVAPDAGEVSGSGSAQGEASDSAGRGDPGRDPDVELLAEALWAGLHGLIVLDRAGRLRPDQRAARIELLVDRLVPERA
jgi:hypothetical protein